MNSTNFCAEDLWDLNLTWYTDHPDFTPCFQKTVFVYTPFIFLCLAIPFELYSNHTSKLRLIPWNWLNLSKIISCAILCLLSAIELVISCAVKWDGPETNETVLADFVGPPVKIATYLISILFVLRMRKSGRVTSGPQFIFWLLQCLCQGLTTVSLISQQKVGLILTSSIGLVCTISFVLILFNFILQWFPDSQQTYLGLDDQSLNLSPESKSSFVSQLLFLWLDKTIWKGRKNTITTSDLWDLSNEESVHTIGPLWDRLWEKSKAQNANKMKKLGLLPSLLQAFGLTFVKCGFLQLTDVLLSFVNPLLLNLIIGFVQGDDPVWKGYFYVVILLATSQLASIIDNRYWYELRRVGIKMKTALSVAIYKKSLHLSNTSRKEKNSGEIVNLVSVDCEKISFSCLFVNFPWIAPLQIGLSIFFLYRTIGVSVFAGLGVIFIFFLVNLVVSSYIENYQTTQMEKKDRRVKLISEILNGIKVIKLFSWESSFFERINKLRKDEVKDLRAIEFLEGAMYFAWNTGPILMALVSFATYVLIDPVNNILDTKTAFVSLTLFNTMKTPLILLPYGITTLIQGFVSVRRIGAFLNMEELDIHSISHDEDCQHPVSLKDASFKWNFEPLEPTILKKINLFVPKGSLIALVGKVGSGKSSLLSALLGEMVRIEGEANVKGDIAYVPQQAWLRNATLKNNILFMKKYEKEKYEKVIEACALTPDLEILPGGDETEIGEKGINLSGGQKQRVSLARAVYNDADIYLLDDPLSAVDSHVGKHLYEKVIGPNGLLRKKTRILVTHGINFLPYVDQIVVMKDGEISEFGSYNELLSKKGAFAEFLAEQNQSLNTNDSDLDDNEIKSKDQKEAAAAIVRRRRCSSINPMTLPTYNEPSQSNEFQVGRDLIEDEALEVHGVKFEVYFYYWKAVGLAIFSITLVLYAIAQSFNIVGSIWLSIWTDDKAASSDNHLRNKYLGIYVGLSLMQAFTIMLGIILVSISTLRASVKLHKDLLEHILMSTMAFFDTTPIGRIINRFSRDMDEVDLMIPNHIKDLLLDLSGVVGTLVIVCFACPIIIAVVIPLIFVFYFIQKLYLSVSRQLKRMINVTASPINSSVTESFQGVSSIRAYKLVDYFIKENCDFVEANQQCEYPEATSNFWLQSRLAILGNLLITCEALLAVVYRGSIEPGLVGLMLTYIFTLQFDMYWLVSYLAELEKSIVSVERIKEYQQTSTEAAFEIEETKPQPEWPQEGAIEFENYGTRYREGLDLVLKGISFQVKPSEKIGIVGRTGAGKSSLTLALFRMIESVQGCIRIDGIDISKLGLSALRSALTIIPQDPVLFTGSLRFNLDPFNRYSDQDIWQTLEHSHLKNFVMQLPNGLDHEVSEGGENLSVGQRQLLCLARALLKKTKVLILDEATAAIDLETDDLIQATIRKEFEDCTVLTIAHRLKTILDNNKILVLDSGKVKEFDKPEILLQNKDTLFYSLAKDAGVV